MGTQSVTSKVQIGDPAPDFTLAREDGSSVHLRDFVGKQAIVLYFYPKDETGGCTTEACAFRDSYEIFMDAGAEVIGVSSDSVESHQKFAIHHRLPFILLSDQSGAVRKLYGAQSLLGLMPGRVTYVIDREGVVRHIFSSQLAPQKHIQEALNVIKEIAPSQTVIEEIVPSQTVIEEIVPSQE